LTSACRFFNSGKIGKSVWHFWSVIVLIFTQILATKQVDFKTAFFQKYIFSFSLFFFFSIRMLFFFFLLCFL